MTDLAGDPLVVVLGLLALAGIATHVLLRRFPLGRAIARVVVLAVLTIATNLWN